MGTPTFDGNFLSSRGWYVSLASNQSTILARHTKLQVTTASQIALAAEANRKYALLVNVSDAPIYLKIGEAAVVEEGIPLLTAGSSYEMSSGLGNLDKRNIYAIHGGTGTKNLLIAEGV